jgi:hypothetical protein
LNPAPIVLLDSQSANPAVQTTGQLGPLPSDKVGFGALMLEQVAQGEEAWPQSSGGRRATNDVISSQSGSTDNRASAAPVFPAGAPPVASARTALPTEKTAPSLDDEPLALPTRTSARSDGAATLYRDADAPRMIEGLSGDLRDARPQTLANSVSRASAANPVVSPNDGTGSHENGTADAAGEPASVTCERGSDQSSRTDTSVSIGEESLRRPIPTRDANALFAAPAERGAAPMKRFMTGGVLQDVSPGSGVSRGGRKSGLSLLTPHGSMSAKGVVAPTQPASGSEPLTGADTRADSSSAVIVSGAAPVSGGIASLRTGGDGDLGASVRHTAPATSWRSTVGPHGAVSPTGAQAPAATLSVNPSQPNLASTNLDKSSLRQQMSGTTAITGNVADRHLSFGKAFDDSGSEFTPKDSVARAGARVHSELGPFVPAAVAASAIHFSNGTTATSPLAVPGDSTRIRANATFERMDSAAPPQTIESSPQRLAVGVRTSELGWVEIRTNNAAGQVSATVAANTAEAHPALTGQLSSMREYLVGQNVHVDHLAWESFPASSDQREGSSGERSPDGGGTRGTKVPEQAISRGTASVDADAESLSYINVRV